MGFMSKHYHAMFAQRFFLLIFIPFSALHTRCHICNIFLKIEFSDFLMFFQLLVFFSFLSISPLRFSRTALASHPTTAFRFLGECGSKLKNFLKALLNEWGALCTLILRGDSFSVFSLFFFAYPLSHLLFFLNSFSFDPLNLIGQHFWVILVVQFPFSENQDLFFFCLYCWKRFFLMLRT